MLKTYLKSYIYLFSIILISLIIVSIINYFLNWSLHTINFIIPIIALLISSIILGKNSKEKAYLEGIKFSSLYLLFTIILKLILKTSFNIKVFITYILMIFSSIIGSMIGINIKKQ